MGVRALVEWGDGERGDEVGKVRRMRDGHGLVLERQVFSGFVQS